jgi:uncharacterized protein (TIGR02145 family)
MKTSVIIVCMLIILMYNNSPLNSQISINTNGNIADTSAILDVSAQNKGVLFPRMNTVQLLNIKGPAIGLIVMNTDSLRFYFFDGNAWRAMSDEIKSINGCGNSFVYQGKNYSTIQIGTQCWMKQNMNAGTRINGNVPQTDNGIIEKHCYNDVEDSCDIYGGLYQWNEMMQYLTTESTRGICPEGYHIPSSAEWDILANYLGGPSVAGGKMKETGIRYWISPNTGATNSSRFCDKGAGTYRPAGYNYFYLIREAGIFWTSTMNGGYNVWRRDTNYSTIDISPYSCEPYHSFSVRCLKDQ